MDLLSYKQKQYAIDVVSGVTAAVCVAPGMAIVDQAVTEKAANPKHTNLFLNAFRNLRSMFLQPRVFFTTPTFKFVCLVYSGTYMTANCLTSMAEFAEKDPFWYKLTGTTVVNVTLGVLKDKYFAQKFSGKPITNFPLTSWGLFIFRDFMTIGAGFTFPPIVSSILQDTHMIEKKESADKIAQIFVPLAAQLVLTPTHLLALDFYNNKQAKPMERITTIRSVLLESFMIRLGRTACAYSIAGVVNLGLKNDLRARYLCKKVI